jgi:hypothetical protein
MSLEPPPKAELGCKEPDTSGTGRFGAMPVGTRDAEAEDGGEFECDLLGDEDDDGAKASSFGEKVVSDKILADCALLRFLEAVSGQQSALLAASSGELPSKGGSMKVSTPGCGADIGRRFKGAERRRGLIWFDMPRRRALCGRAGTTAEQKIRKIQ